MNKFILMALIFTSMIVPAQATEITANVTLPRGTVLSMNDITIKATAEEDVVRIRTAYVGMELTRPVYAGHAITAAHLRYPLLVKRNKIVTMVYQYGTMTISTYGRSLGEGSMGDIVELMNINSRQKVQAIVIGPDKVKVR